MRSALLQIGHLGGITSGGAQLSFIAKSLLTTKHSRYLWNCSLTAIRKMMVDTSAASEKGSISNLSPARDEDGSYSSGGLKR